MKDSFIMYSNMGDSVSELCLEQKGKLWEAVFAYQSGTDYECDDPEVRLAFRFIKSCFERDKKTYEGKCRKNRESGHLGGRPTKNRTVSEKPNGLQETERKKNNPIDLDIGFDFDSENLKKEKRGTDVSRSPSKNFLPPSESEVEAYCRERGNSVNATSFVAFYESKGWMVGKNTMKDWRGAVRTWEQRDNGGGLFGNGRKDPTEGCI